MSQPSQPSETAPQPETTLEVGGCRITLLGTAHVSRASVEAVQERLASGRFDRVAVELCEGRLESLMNAEAQADVDLFQVIRSGRVPSVAAQLALGAFQRRLADALGIEPGAEMRAAVEAARERDLPLALIDRDAGTTLRRIYRNIPWWRRPRLFAGLAVSLFDDERIDEAEIERLKEGDVLEGTFAQFAERERELFVPLIDERDRYMAARLTEEARRCRGGHLLAVVGAGHLEGIARYLGEGVERPAETVESLEHVPPGSRWWRRLPWLVVGLVLAGFVAGFLRSPELGWQMVGDWVLINGALSALGALLALAHPLTVLAAALAAPLTSLNPTIGAGMVTAGVELFLRRPTVGDFARLREETVRVSGWWRNRVTRILLVFLLSSLGSALGTYLAGFRLIGRLAG